MGWTKMRGKIARAHVSPSVSIRKRKMSIRPITEIDIPMGVDLIHQDWDEVLPNFYSPKIVNNSSGKPLVLPV